MLPFLTCILFHFRETVICTLGPGGYFGEVGLIFGESRTADVRTKTYCEITMLQKKDLDYVLRTFPLVDHQFKMTSGNNAILENMKAASRNAEEKVKEAVKQRKRIDMIEETKNRRSKSVFQHLKDRDVVRTKEELAIENELKSEITQPYENLYFVARILSYILMKRTIEPEGSFHFWLQTGTYVSVYYNFFLSVENGA